MAPKSGRGSPVFPEWTLAEAYAQAVTERAEFEARAAQAAAAHPMASLRRPRPASMNPVPTQSLSSLSVRDHAPGIPVPGSAPVVGIPRPMHPMARLQHAARYSSHDGVPAHRVGSESSLWRPSAASFGAECSWLPPSRCSSTLLLIRTCPVSRVLWYVMRFSLTLLDWCLNLVIIAFA